jgi:GNAT superfamily N-acetyltransferase/RimJ/RimL family protein N-acetyltransferase
MEIVALDLADDKTVAACHAVGEDAARADDPVAPPMSAKVFRFSLSAGWNGGSFETWYVPDGDGTVAGWYRVEFPDLENLDRALVQLTVHPARRRGGIGTALLRHAADRAAAAGRKVLSSEIQEGSPGKEFALRMGATLGIVEVRRIQDLARIPQGTIARLHATAAGAASGYSLVRWAGVVPEERVDQVAVLHEALNDSPMDATVEPAVWTPERVRGRMNTRIARSPMRRYSLAASHDDTGEMAALTVVTVDPDVPDWGHQQITAVTRAHRGYRLGLLVKTAMLGWLAETEPRLAHIETWNAGANEHMIAINESLGYAASGEFRSAELAVAARSMEPR